MCEEGRLIITPCDWLNPEWPTCLMLRWSNCADIVPLQSDKRVSSVFTLHNDSHSHYLMERLLSDTVLGHWAWNKVLWIAYLLGMFTSLCTDRRSAIHTDHKLLSWEFQTNSSWFVSSFTSTFLLNVFFECQGSAVWEGLGFPCEAGRGAHFWGSLMKGFEPILCWSWTQKYIHLDSSSNSNFQHGQAVTVRSVQYFY